MMPTNHTPEFCGTDTFVDLAFNMSQKQPQLSDLKVATAIAISAIEEAHALKEKVALLELAFDAARSQSAQQQQAEPGADERVRHYIGGRFVRHVTTPAGMQLRFEPDGDITHVVVEAAQSDQRAGVAEAE